MPIPLRLKRIFGIPYNWVVHQPFFCQFLGVFSADQTCNPVPFIQLMQQHFRYGSTFRIHLSHEKPLPFDGADTESTQVLDLSSGYGALYQGYSHDRKQNLKRALLANWTIVDSADPEPLIMLFHENHAFGIDGGVANWAYDILRNLIAELSKRKLMTMRYACQNGHIDAGVLFVYEGNRIIYLFNAASEAGRRENARTLLIDQLIQEKAGMDVILDFESPEKLAIRDFYRSFGAVEEPFYALRWNRLSLVENLLRVSRRMLR